VPPLVIKRSIISMIPKLNASPWSGDRRILPNQRSHG
jgi:hypothetical protein